MRLYTRKPGRNHSGLRSPLLSETLITTDAPQTSKWEQSSDRQTSVYRPIYSSRSEALALVVSSGKIVLRKEGTEKIKWKDGKEQNVSQPLFCDVLTLIRLFAFFIVNSSISSIVTSIITVLHRTVTKQ